MENNLKKRKVDICLCGKNCAHVLNNALDTIRKMMTTVDCNVILVDGRSSDNTPQMMVDFRQEDTSKVLVLQTEENSTYIDAYNLALNNTVSDYIAWLDADDICDENRLKIQADYLDNNKDVSVVTSSVYLPNKQMIINTLTNFNDEQMTNLLENNQLHMFEMCHFQSAMFRRKCLTKFKNGKYFFDEYAGGRGGEGFLYMLHFLGYKFANITDTYYVYTMFMNPVSLSNNLDPLFAKAIDEMPYEDRKKALMKIYRKNNKKVEE